MCFHVCRLLRELLPGPVTVVLQRRADAHLSPYLNPGVETIGKSTSLFETKNTKNTMYW